MNEPTLSNVTAELSDRLTGQKFGKIFSLSKFQLAIDFRLPDGEYLFICVEPGAPRIYLIKRRLKALEKQSNAQPSFVSLLRKKLSHAIVTRVEKFENERVLKLEIQASSEMGETNLLTLVVQLTGRSSNLFLLDAKGFIVDTLRAASGDRQYVGTKYEVPQREGQQDGKIWKAFSKGDHESLSEALDIFYREKDAQNLFRSRAKAAESKVDKELKKKHRLQTQLNGDLQNHGNPEKWKHFGDLLLANASTAKRSGDKISVIDYFDANAPTIEIVAKEELSITEAAGKYFKRYTKARNAKKAISKRLEVLSAELEELESKKQTLAKAISAGDLAIIDSFLGTKVKETSAKKKRKKQDVFTGVKRYVSTDGFDILVGKRSKDNDYLTFRLAKSLDTWLHAADYPGSHVVIRNPNRKEIPHNTLLESAQLAAFFSKAKKEAKVAVHYTQKKFVNKPKGVAPGLVSLASFKTVLVEPKITVNKKEAV